MDFTPLKKKSDMNCRTPTECRRLMGWKDEQINLIKAANISNAQMYKQAGNGIVINVLEAIFKKLLSP